MELKNQEIPATVEPPVRPTDEEITKAAHAYGTNKHPRKGHRATASFDDFVAGVKYATSKFVTLHPQPAAVAPTMSKEEIEELVRLEKLDSDPDRFVDHAGLIRLYALRAKLAKMGSGS